MTTGGVVVNRARLFSSRLLSSWRGRKKDWQRVEIPRIHRNAWKRYLVIAAIFKNEAPYLVEWVQFQRLVGVEHIYLYDNGSEDRPEEVLAPFIRDGFVTVIPWRTFNQTASPQHLAYSHAIANYGPACRWMSFIDIDEFLFPVEKESLPAVLQGYEDVPALAVPWVMFGFSGHQARPDGLTIANYTMRHPFPPLPRRKSLFKWKLVADPAQITAIRNTHTFEFVGGLVGGLDENRSVLNEETRYQAPRTADVLRVNHYALRSKAEFEDRLGKSSVTFESRDTYLKRRQRFATLIEEETIRDAAILRFLPSLLMACETVGDHSTMLDQRPSA